MLVQAWLRGLRVDYSVAGAPVLSDFLTMVVCYLPDLISGVESLPWSQTHIIQDVAHIRIPFLFIIVDVPRLTKNSLLTHVPFSQLFLIERSVSFFLIYLELTHFLLMLSEHRRCLLMIILLLNLCQN